MYTSVEGFEWYCFIARARFTHQERFYSVSMGVEVQVRMIGACHMYTYTYMHVICIPVGGVNGSV